jgi:hypothetical protein
LGAVPFDVGIAEKNFSQFTGGNSIFHANNIRQKAILKNNGEFDLMLLADCNELLATLKRHFKRFFNHYMLAGFGNALAIVKMRSAWRANRDDFQTLVADELVPVVARGDVEFLAQPLGIVEIPAIYGNQLSIGQLPNGFSMHTGNRAAADYADAKFFVVFGRFQLAQKVRKIFAQRIKPQRGQAETKKN